MSESLQPSAWPVCLTIAGSDSGGGAGIQADLKTFASLSCYGTSTITAITAQNTLGVQAVQGISKEIVGQQIDSVWSDMQPKAVKTGMLFSKEVIEEVVQAFKRNSADAQMDCPPIIVDPVMVSTSGHTLLSEDAVDTLREALLPWATVLTPNLAEAAILAGLPKDGIDSEEAMVACARSLGKLGPRYILLKGGHMPLPARNSEKSYGATNGQRQIILDILYDVKSDKVTTFVKDQLDSKNTHGTGCTLSAAICAHLANGKSVKEAVSLAGEYVKNAIAGSYAVGSGAGPVNHLHTMASRTLTNPNIHSPHPFTDYLISRMGPLWDEYVAHPFTIQLGNGTLPMKSFLFFIKQDWHFLKHYARTNALAAYKSKTFEDIQASAFIVQTVLDEVKMHVEYCQTQGISKEELESTRESITNIAYNRYVLDVSASGSMLDLRVATAPCLLGYGEVGLRLADPSNKDIDRSPSNKYYKWAINYGKEEFQEAVRTGRTQLERMVVDNPLSKERLEELVEIFRQTTELEVAFWTTALEAGRE